MQKENRMWLHNIKRNNRVNLYKIIKIEFSKHSIYLKKFEKIKK